MPYDLWASHHIASHPIVSGIRNGCFDVGNLLFHSLDFNTIYKYCNIHMCWIAENIDPIHICSLHVHPSTHRETQTHSPAYTPRREHIRISYFVHIFNMHESITREYTHIHLFAECVQNFLFELNGCSEYQMQCRTFHSISLALAWENATKRICYLINLNGAHGFLWFKHIHTHFTRLLAHSLNTHTKFYLDKCFELSSLLSFHSSSSPSVSRHVVHLPPS